MTDEKELRAEAESTLQAMTIDLAIQNPDAFMPVFDYGVHVLATNHITPHHIKLEAVMLQKKIKDADAFIQKVVLHTSALEIYNAFVDEITLKYVEKFNLDEVQRQAIMLVVSEIIRESLDADFGKAVEHQLMGRVASIVVLKTLNLDGADGESKDSQWVQK